jgi:hypothetical protein
MEAESMKAGNRHRMSFGFVAALLLSVTGCSAARPVLYPNEHYNSVGEVAAQRDIDECMARGREFAKGGSQAEAKARDAAKSAAYGGVSGAAVGAVGGAIGGNAGEGAAVGAATGATAGLFHSLFGGFFGPSGPDPVEGSFVDRCLREKGYDPIGWR